MNRYKPEFLEKLKSIEQIEVGSLIHWYQKKDHIFTTKVVKIEINGVYDEIIAEKIASHGLNVSNKKWSCSLNTIEGYISMTSWKMYITSPNLNYEKIKRNYITS